MDQNEPASNNTLLTHQKNSSSGDKIHSGQHSQQLGGGGESSELSAQIILGSHDNEDTGNAQLVVQGPDYSESHNEELDNRDSQGEDFGEGQYEDYSDYQSEDGGRDHRDFDGVNDY